jgi:hypothetical protein
MLLNSEIIIYSIQATLLCRKGNGLNHKPTSHFSLCAQIFSGMKMNLFHPFLSLVNILFCQPEVNSIH